MGIMKRELERQIERNSYFVVMIDYGRRGREAIVDPEITRQNVIDRIVTGEYRADQIAFIHSIHDGVCEDVTSELIDAAGLPESNVEEIDLQALRFDRAHDIRKNYEPAE